MDTFMAYGVQVHQLSVQFRMLPELFTLQVPYICRITSAMTTGSHVEEVTVYHNSYMLEAKPSRISGWLTR